MTSGQVMSACLGIATRGVSLWAVGYNWLSLFQGLRGRHRSSPGLLIGPLFAFIAGGPLWRSLPGGPCLIAWLAGVAGLVLDPAALPLVAGALFRRTAASPGSS